MGATKEFFKDVFDPDNALTALKAVVVTIIVSLILVVPMWFVDFFLGDNQISMLVRGFIGGIALLGWGYLAQRFWKWS